MNRPKDGTEDTEVAAVDQRLQSLMGNLHEVRLNYSVFERGELMTSAKQIQRSRRIKRRVKAVSLVATPLALAVIAWGALRPAVLVGTVDQQMVVRLKDSPTSPKQVAYVQVELPPNVQFAADGSPEISNQPVLVFPWSMKGDLPAFPLMIKSHESGSKRIKVKYLDEAGRELSDQSIRVKFAPAFDRRGI